MAREIGMGRMTIREIALNCAIKLVDFVEKDLEELKVISYGELGKRIGYDDLSTNMAGVLVGKSMCCLRGLCEGDFSAKTGYAIPKLNAIVVNAKRRTHPPESWIDPPIASESKNIERWQNELSEIASFGFWPEVAQCATSMLNELVANQHWARYKSAALKILPVLVKLAQEGHCAAYGDIRNAAGLGSNQNHFYGGLGYIQNVICEKGTRLPFLNALGYNKKTKFGTNWREGLDDISEEDQEKKWRDDVKDVLAYGHWDAVLEEYNLQPSNEDVISVPFEGQEASREPLSELLKRLRTHNQVNQDKEAKPSSSTNRGGYTHDKLQKPEGEEHVYLKNAIASDPSLVLGHNKYDFVCIEYPFISGDRCDIVICISNSDYAVIEVEPTTGVRGQLVGAFQALKYRELMKAELLYEKPRKVTAYLATPSISKLVSGFCRDVDVHVKIISLKK